MCSMWIKVGNQLRISCVVAVGAMLCACASSVSGSEALSLYKNQGLVGVEFVTDYSGRNFQLKLSGPFGKTLNIDDAPAGESIYLFKLAAGHYCIAALFMSYSDVYLKPRHGMPCFDVAAGHLAYAGTVANRLKYGYVVDMRDFLKALKNTYPKVYKRYVIGKKSVAKPSI